MQHRTRQADNSLMSIFRERASLSERAEDVLVAVAVLGLASAVVDGEVDSREIATFEGIFTEQFALSRAKTRKLLGLAIRVLRAAEDCPIIDRVCDTLNEHLDVPQKLRLFEGLAQVLVADGKVHFGEEAFLEHIARRLHLDLPLTEKYLLM